MKLHSYQGVSVSSAPVKSRKKIAFEGRIIDSHTHVGDFYDGIWKKQVKFTPENLNNQAQMFNGDTVEKMLVSNLSCMSSPSGQPGAKPFLNEKEGNLAILNASKQDGRLVPLAVCQPGKGSAETIEKLIKENKEFKGLKFHPELLGLEANDKLYEPYMKVAQENKLPCLFHSAPGKSDPKLIYQLAQKYPEVPVVLGHMNLATGNLSAEQKIKINAEAIDIVKESIKNKNANLFLEVSWAHPSAIIKAIQEVGPERVLFGTDAPFEDFNAKLQKSISYPERIESVKNAIKENFGKKSEDIIDKVFFNNSNKLFSLGLVNEATRGNRLNARIEKTKAAAMIIGTVGILTGIYTYLIHRCRTQEAQMKAASFEGKKRFCQTA